MTNAGPRSFERKPRAIEAQLRSACYFMLTKRKLAEHMQQTLTAMEEPGLELSPTKINFIQSHLAAATPVAMAGQAKEGSPASVSSTVLSGGAETETEICLQNFLMGVKALLVIGTVCGFCAVYLIARDLDPASSAGWPFMREIAAELACNIPIGFLAFFIADTVAYFIMREGMLDEDEECDAPSYAGNRPALWRRALVQLLCQSLQAGVIGMVSVGVVDTLWLSRLNVVLPSDSVGVQSAEDGGRLMLKSLVDSLVYGVAANSWGILARRVMFKGETLGQALGVWDMRILSVMSKELVFWPMWNAINFLCVAQWAQVAFVGFGGLCWNIFISIEARRHAHFLEGWEALADDHVEAAAGSQRQDEEGGAATRIETRISSSGMTTKFTTLAPTPPSHACTPLAAHRVRDGSDIGERRLRAAMAARYPMEGRISSPVPAKWRRRAALPASPPASATRCTPVSRWILWREVTSDSAGEVDGVRARLTAADTYC